MTSSGAPHGGHCLSSWSQNLPGVTQVRRREQVPGGPLPTAPSWSEKALQPPAPGIGSQSFSSSKASTWSLQLRSAEAVKRQAEWKEAHSSLGGVPRAAAGFRLTLCGAQESVPDRGLVAVYCGPGCYLALKGAWQPGSVQDDVFLHKPGALQAYGEGSASFYPHPRTQQAQGRQGISYRTWKRSGQTEPQGFIPSVSSSRRGNLEPGKQSVLTTSHRAAWPQLCPWTLPGSPASCLLCEHQGVKRAPSWHVHCDQTLSFLLTPRSSF